MTGLQPERVAAFMDRQSTAVDVVDALTVRFRGGVLGTIGSTGSVMPRTHTDILEYIIHGTHGHLQFNVADGLLQAFGDDQTVRSPDLVPEERYPMWRPAENLIEVALGLAGNGSPASIAQLTVEAVEAAYRSAAQDGEPVEPKGISS